MENSNQTYNIDAQELFVEMFKELIEEGQNIKIIYSLNPTYRGDKDDFDNAISQVIINSVNDCGNLIEFATRISVIGDSGLSKVEDYIKGIPKEAIAVLLISLIEEFDSLKNNIIHQDLSIEIENKQLIEFKMVLFLNFQFSGPVEPSITEIKKEIQEESHTFAKVWEHSIDAIKERLRYIIIRVSTNEHDAPRELATKVHQSFIKTGMTVEQIAYLFNVLSRERIIDVEYGEGESLYRNIASTFLPLSKKQAQASTIKVRYNTPEPGAIIYWQKAINHIAKIIDKDFDDIGK